MAQLSVGVMDSEITMAQMVDGNSLPEKMICEHELTVGQAGKDVSLLLQTLGYGFLEIERRKIYISLLKQAILPWTSIWSSKYDTTLTNGGKFGKSNIAWFIFSHLPVICWHCAVCKPEKFTYFLGKDKVFRTL